MGVRVWVRAIVLGASGHLADAKTSSSCRAPAEALEAALSQEEPCMAAFISAALTVAERQNLRPAGTWL